MAALPLFAWLQTSSTISFNHSQSTAASIAFGILISNISDIQCLIYLCTFCWCSRSSTFFQDICPSTRVVFFGYMDTPWTCITFGIFISDISDIQHLIYLCMLQKFRIFLGHLPEHQSCFFSDILDTPRTSVTFKIFMSGISDIQYLISLCTFCWCSGSSAFFQDIYPTITVVFLWIFRTLPGHVLHLTCLFQIFRTFRSSFICAHSPDAPEVLHLFQDIYLSTGAVFFRIFRTLPGHVLHLTYLFRIFRTLSTSFICACFRSSASF